MNILSLRRLTKEEKIAKRRFVGASLSERRTPGRKRKNAAADSAATTTTTTPVAAAVLVTASTTTTTTTTATTPAVVVRRPRGGKSLSARKKTLQPSPVLVIPAFTADEVTCSADEPESVMARDPLATTGTVAAASAAAAGVPVDGVIATGPPLLDANGGGGVPITSPLKTIVKKCKRRIRIDDDDESPTFNPLVRQVRRGGGRGSRGGGRGSRGGGRGGQQRSVVRQVGTGQSPESMFFLGSTPDKAKDAEPEPRPFASPDGGIVFASPPEAKVSALF